MNGLYKYLTTIYNKITDKSNKKTSTITFTPTNYPSDVTDKEWEIIERFFPYGNQSGHHKRSLVNAVFYITRTGCQWEQLPKCFPPYNTVWSFFRRARNKGVWNEVNKTLVKMTRVLDGRDEVPSYGLIDSQNKVPKPNMHH